MCKIMMNDQLKGIELYFEEKPPQTTINQLKENGYRWHNTKKCWYAKQSEKTINIANIINSEDNSEAETLTPTQPKQSQPIIKTKNNIIDLWNLTRWTLEEGKNVNKNLTPKEITAEVRKHAKERFPFVKFSVTCKNYNSIQFYIMSAPFEKESIYLKAIQDYCTKLLESYQYCTCYDPYGDYGSSYNFYGDYARIDYSYRQTEQTEEIKKAIADFDIKLVEFEKAEEERKEKEYQEYKIKQEQENKEYLQAEEERKNQIEIINNSVTIKELNEDEQYYIINSQFAKLNKNNTLQEYKEEIAKGEEEYYLQNVKITREIHFSTDEALNYFSNNLLTDFDFLSNSGGSYTEDNRIQTMTDFHQMTEEERKTVLFNLYGIAIYYNNELQFIIDTQGYNYSRYVGLVDNVTIQKEFNFPQVITTEEQQILKNKADALQDYSIEVITEQDILKTWNNENWTEYKNALKAKLKENNFRLSQKIIQQITEEFEEFKILMYRLLVEVDGIQEQFSNADLKQGQKLTLIYISDFGGMVTSRIIFDSVTNCEYAQYKDNVKITFKPEGKRKLYYKHHHSDILVFDGWHEVPKNILYNIEQKNGFIVTSTKYLSCDKNQYDVILEHFEQQGIKPIINTYKPTF